jgi:hypothetical protein
MTEEEKKILAEVEEDLKTIRFLGRLFLSFMIFFLFIVFLLLARG